MAKEVLGHRFPKVIIFICLLVGGGLLLSPNLWAAGKPLSGVLLPGQSDSLQFDPRLEKDYVEREMDKIHLIGTGEDEDLAALKTKLESAAVSGKAAERNLEKMAGGLTSREDYPLSGRGPGEGPYLENSDLKFYHEYANLGKKFITLSYIFDRFTYENKLVPASFDYLLKQSSRRKKVSAAQFTLGQNLHWKFLEPFWGVNFGVSYLRGRGMFKTKGTESETVFVLWVVPAEVFLGFSINLTSWMKLGGMAGPSAVWLSQNRSDYKADDSRKRLQQIGWGYFAQVYAKIGLGRWFPGITRNLYHSYKMTNFYLQPMLRWQSFTHFQEKNIEIGGVSMAVGLAFDFR